jgi:hypothetical protein
MRFDLASLLSAAWASVKDPRQGAQHILNLRASPATAAQALLAMAILSGLMSVLVVHVSAQMGEDLGPMALLSPLSWVMFQSAGLFFLAGAIHLVGRLFGGTGRATDAMALMAWVQLIMLGLQILQFAVLLLVPPLSLLLGILVLGVNIWLMVHFTAALHGFTSPIKVFIGMVGSGLAMMVLATLLLTAILGLSGF